MSFAMRLSPSALLLAGVALVSFWLAVTAWRYRQIARAHAFFVMTTAMGIWLVGSSLESFSVDLVDKIVWAKLSYLGRLSVPLSWAVFALAYTGRTHWLTRRNIVLASIVPVLTLGAVLTNEWHGLIWPRVWLGDGRMMVEHGTGFWLHIAYSYTLVMFGLAQYVRLAAKTEGVHRLQALVMVLGASAPFMGNVLYLSGAITLLDPTPLFFGISALALAWGLFRLGLLEIIPVAREQVIENMSDAVVVLNDQNRVLDLNPAARRMLGVEMSAAVGQPAAELLRPWSELIERSQGQPFVQAEIMNGAPDDRHYFDTRISAMIDRRGQLAGRLIVILDITERRHVEELLRHAQEEIRVLRIEIDQVKRARQVAEITETDYFENLRQRASEMRALRQHTPPPE